MYQSPNANKIMKMNQRNNPFSLGNNNLHARFKKALSILLSTEYYEGSKYGKVYNQFKNDGRSQIYINQPMLESKIQKQFVEIENDVVKFLVGPTGVGKTTLIRNVFKVFDREVTVTDNNLIIYVSFYSMASYLKDTEDSNTVVLDAVLGAINGAISYLDGRDYADRLFSYDEAYYSDVYNFVKTNNPHLLHTVYDTSSNVGKVQSGSSKRYILDCLAEHKPIDYRMCQLKYYLHLYKKRTNSMFDNIILILDDTEALASKYANSVVEFAYQSKKCLQANYNREYNFKVLITMRNYSYRIEQIRRKEAFREIPWDDVIMKDTVPKLNEIINKRAEYVLELKEVLNSVEDVEAYRAAARELKVIDRKSVV